MITQVNHCWSETNCLDSPTRSRASRSTFPTKAGLRTPAES
jgi:hypothetical protein